MGSDVLAHQKTQAVTNLTSSYYTIIPHAFGRDRPVLISTEKHLKEEVDKLDTLSKMGLASEIMHDKIYKDDDGNAVHFKDSQFRRLRIKSIEPLSSLSAEFKALEDYLVKSSRTDHHLKFRVETIFRIERTGENERFSQRFECVKPETSDRRLLWHGSVTTNFAGILSEGLRIAPLEAPKNGYMFGRLSPARLASMSLTTTRLRQGHLPRRCVLQVGELLPLLSDRRPWSSAALRSRCRTAHSADHHRSEVRCGRECGERWFHRHRGYRGARPQQMEGRRCRAS